MEETKFWTKGKLIILGIIILVIAAIYLGIYLHNSNLKKEYKKLESEFNLKASNYLLFEGITLKSGQWRKIDIKNMVAKKFVNNKYSKDCTGYVLASANKNSNTINYETHIKCGNIYETENRNVELSKKDENKSKTQSEKDTTKPVITLLGKSTQTIKLNSKYKDKGATAIDNVDGDVTKKIKVTNNVNTSVIGEYLVKYTVSDKAGNKANKTRKVIVKENAKSEKKDTTEPVITFNSDIIQTICAGETIDTSKTGIYGYIAYDDKDGDITDKVSITGDTGAANEIKTYTLIYTVSDKAGNKYSTTRTYNTKDCSAPAPVITQPAPAPTAPATPSYSGGGNDYSGSSGSSSSSSSSSSSGSSGGVPSSQTNTTVSVTNIRISPTNLSLSVGGSHHLDVTVIPSNATNKNVSFSSSNSSVASVDGGGNIRANSRGTAIITATNGNVTSNTCIVNVN